MDFDLGELGQTLAIGSVLVVGIEIAVYALFGRTLLPYHMTVERSPYRVAASVVSVACVLALGILVEDVSKSVVGRSPPERLRACWPFALILPQEQSLCADALFECVRGEPRSPVWKPRDLASDFCRRGLFKEHGGDRGASLQVALLENGYVKDDLLVQEGSRSLYYDAKNTVYQNANYFSELQRIKARIDFARSFCFVCIVVLLVLVIVFVSRALCPPLAALTARCPWALLGMNPRSEHITLSGVRRSLALGVMLTFGCCLGQVAFISEQYNYNSRVFGYFRTIHDAQSASNWPATQPMIRGPVAFQ